MRWLRSWPAEPVDGRPHVRDGLPRLRISDYDYWPLVAVWSGRRYAMAESVIVLEWDVAMDPEDAEAFAAACEAEPAKVRVAPYRLHDSMGHRWAHRIVTNGQSGAQRWVEEGEPFCDLFGFGAVYLPGPTLAAFGQADPETRARPPWAPADYSDRRLTDQTFSIWHYLAGRGPVPIEWGARCVHLNPDGGLPRVGAPW